MKEVFINSSFNYITKNKELDKIGKIKIKYGLEVMYHFVTKTIVILLLSIVFNIFKQTLLIFIFFAPLRTFAHGLHAKSNIECWISSIFIYIVIGLYIKYFYLENIIIIALIIISIISFIFYAPADTKNLPLVNKHKRLSLKIKSLVISILYLVISLLIKYQLIKEVICFSLTLQAILINPFIYKITKSTFNNYQNYNC